MENNPSDESPPPPLGKIILISGPMYARKTGALIDVIDECILFKKPYLALKWKDDDRYTTEEKLATLNGRMAGANILTLEQADAYLLANTAIKNVVVDEAQFWEGISDYAKRWKLRGLHVYCGGLNGTFEQTYFEQVALLTVHADETRSMQTCCMYPGCDERANYSSRKDPNDTKLVSIGGLEKYESLCLRHVLLKKTTQ